MASTRTLEWVPPGAEILGLPATTATAAGLLFLSGVTPWNSDEGQAVQELQDVPTHVPETLGVWGEHQWGREGPAIAQAWAVCQALGRVLEIHNRSPADVVRQRVYLTRPEDVRPVEEVLLAFYGDSLPATTLVVVSSTGASYDLRVWADFIVDARPPDSAPLRRVKLPAIPIVDPYPLAVVVDQLVFFSGLSGVSPATGEPARLNELGQEAQAALGGTSRLSGRGDAAYAAQIGMIHAHLERILRELGGDLGAMVRLTGVTSRSMTESGIWQPFHVQLQGTRERTPVLTYLTGGDRITNHDGIDAICDGVALLPGPQKLTSTLQERVEMAVLPMTKAAGPLVVNTGYIGMNRDTHKPYMRLRELGGSAALLGIGRADTNEQLVSQAWHVFSVLEELFVAEGSALSHVAHQTVYLLDLALRPALEAVAAAFMQKLPPTTYVPVQDIGPYPGLLFEVEAFAVRSAE